MGRPRKTAAEHKQNGTYRKDRYSKQELAEKKVSEILEFNETTKLLPPATLTDSYVKQYFLQHTKLLIKLKILNPVDIPELENMYETLEQLRKVQKEIAKLDITNFDNLKAYEVLSKLSLKLGHRFSELAAKYYITPSARTHLQLDNLELENKKIETKTVIQKLLENKKG